jgi:hypothetical protein
VNSRYVIATSAKVDLKGIDEKTLEKVSAPDYFTKDKAAQKKSSEEAFFTQGEQPEVGIYNTSHVGICGVWTDVWRDAEEENRIWACNRPEVDRQDAPVDDQERAVPGELSCEQLQLKKRRQAARDEVLGNDSAVVDQTYGDEAKKEGWDMPGFITQAENGDMGCESRDATITHRSLSKLAHARVRMLL